MSTEHKKGRPTRTEQLQMQKELRKYFERGTSATVTSSSAGINLKTVCKYFDEWADQIIESETADFLERQKKEHQRIILSFEYEIKEAYKLFDEINLEIENIQKEGKPVPRHLFSIKLDLMRFISNLKERKGALSMQPTMESAIDKKIEKMIAKHVKDSQGN